MSASHNLALVRSLGISGTDTTPTSPRGLWLKTLIYEDGSMLRAKSFLSAGGKVEVINTAIDLKTLLPLAKKIMAARVEGQCAGCIGEEECSGCREAVIGGWGFFKSIGKLVKKIGKTKLLKGISRIVKKVVKSKLVGSMAAGLAIIYPPVGAPVLAAYAAARTAITAVEKHAKIAAAVVNDVKKLATAKNLAKSVTPAILKAKPELRITLKAGVSAKQGLQAAKSDPKLKATLASVAENGKKAKAFIAATVSNAKYAQNPQKRDEARKAAAILVIAKQTHERLAQAGAKEPVTGKSGHVIDSKGRIIHGRWVESMQAKGAMAGLFVAASGKVQAGHFLRVAGCFAC